jgi:A/G-specific adenine glycosylase
LIFYDQLLFSLCPLGSLWQQVIYQTYMSKTLLTQRNKTEFQDALMSWYEKSHRRLPWRETRDPYRIWVSEVMLQQTQVSTVIRYYQQFIKKFPDVRALAQADTEEVLKSWELLGYYARARNLHRAAKMVTEKYNGIIPDSYDCFRELPGVGEYIAAAVMSIAFGQPYPVLDGNVKRVMARLFMLNFPVNEVKNKKKIYAKLKVVFAENTPGKFNQAIMELGALICKPRRPDCPGCPVSKYCGAYLMGKPEKYPVKVIKKALPEHAIAVGVIENEGKVLITRRREEGLLGGLWEFPGGKISARESAADACVREISEEVNLGVLVTGHLTRVKHAYSHFRITMDVYLCKFLEGTVELNGPVDFRWISLPEIDRYPYPAATHKFLPLVKERLADYGQKKSSAEDES